MKCNELSSTPGRITVYYNSREFLQDSDDICVLDEEEEEEKTTIRAELLERESSSSSLSEFRNEIRKRDERSEQETVRFNPSSESFLLGYPGLDCAIDLAISVFDPCNDYELSYCPAQFERDELQNPKAICGKTHETRDENSEATTCHVKNSLDESHLHEPIDDGAFESSQAVLCV
eukprot:scaffold24404_cov103-Cylindrotheca_fusiformis.AAC.1